MASYLVLEPQNARHTKVEDAVIIRDGFAFLAFLLPLFWFLWHRMWLEALAVLCLGLILAALGSLPDFVVVSPVLSLLLAVFIGLEARGLRVAALKRRGWDLWGVVEATSRNEAEIRYAAERLQESGDAETEPRRSTSTPAAVPVIPPPGSAPGPSFGLIDYPGRM